MATPTKSVPITAREVFEDREEFINRIVLASHKDCPRVVPHFVWINSSTGVKCSMPCPEASEREQQGYTFEHDGSTGCPYAFADRETEEDIRDTFEARQDATGADLRDFLADLPTMELMIHVRYWL